MERREWVECMKCPWADGDQVHSLLERNGEHGTRGARRVLGSWVVGVPFSVMGMIGKGAHGAGEI